jgi:hypothetical protein
MEIKGRTGWHSTSLILDADWLGGWPSLRYLGGPIRARNKGCKCTRTCGDLVGDSVIRRLRPGQITTPRIQYKYLPPPSIVFSLLHPPSTTTFINQLHFSIRFFLQIPSNLNQIRWLVPSRLPVSHSLPRCRCRPLERSWFPNGLPRLGQVAMTRDAPPSYTTTSC